MGVVRWVCGVRTRVREWRLRESRRELEERNCYLERSNHALAKDINARAEQIAILKRYVEKLACCDLPPWLSPAEIERLTMLAEECGEVIQAVGKVLRHGWESQSPYGGKPNRVTLERELGDVRAVVNLMLDADDLRLAEIQTWQRRKREKIPAWTHHQADSMPREAQLAMMRAVESARTGMER